MLPRSDSKLAPLARSWLQAPEIESLSDCRGQGYDPSQRAYVLGATGAAPSFRIAASAERPIVNPCFVVKNWGDADAKLALDGKTIPQGKDFRFGHRRTLEGTDLIVWIKTESQAARTFRLEPR